MRSMSLFDKSVPVSGSRLFDPLTPPMNFSEIKELIRKLNLDENYLYKLNLSFNNNK